MSKDGMKKDTMSRRHEERRNEKEARPNFVSRRLTLLSGRACYIREAAATEAAAFSFCGRHNARRAAFFSASSAASRRRGLFLFPRQARLRPPPPPRLEACFWALAASRASLALARSAACASRSARPAPLQPDHGRTGWLRNLFRMFRPRLLRRLLPVPKLTFRIALDPITDLRHFQVGGETSVWGRGAEFHGGSRSGAV